MATEKQNNIQAKAYYEIPYFVTLRKAMQIRICAENIYTS